MQPRHFQFWPRHLPKRLTYPRTTLVYNLQVSAARYPDKPLLIYYGSILSYAQALHEVESLAGFLQQRCAVKRGDRVLLYMQNSPQFVLGYYAILRADAVVVPVNPMNLTQELEHYLQDSGAQTALVGQEVYTNIRPLLGNAALKHVVLARYGDYCTQPTDLALPDSVTAGALAVTDQGVTRWREALDHQCVASESLAQPEDLCVLPYTSGTTGKPKGCMHTHATVMSTVLIASSWGGIANPELVSLNTLPYFHVTGMQSGMNAPIYLGSTVVLMTRWDRTTAARLIERYRVSSWTYITTMAVDFLSNPELQNYDLTSLVSIGGGGAAMPAAVATKLKDTLGLDYIEGYGLTETIAPTHINPHERPKKQCLGIPVCDTDVRVIHPETRQCLGPNEVGEIVSHGPQIFRGYWNAPLVNEECFIELEGKRFFRTGDLGQYDEEGYYFIVDRLKRMINASGYKVWPAEVEALLYHHPRVLEACVIGTLDARRGESVKALVVLRAGPDVSAEELIHWCRENMASYKVPRQVEFVASLPKSATGKIQWRLLQEQEKARPTQ